MVVQKGAQQSRMCRRWSPQRPQRWTQVSMQPRIVPQTHNPHAVLDIVLAFDLGLAWRVVVLRRSAPTDVLQLELLLVMWTAQLRQVCRNVDALEHPQQIPINDWMLVDEPRIGQTRVALSS